MPEESLKLISTLSKFVLDFWKKSLKFEEMERKTFDSTKNHLDELSKEMEEDGRLAREESAEQRIKQETDNSG
jgi:DNA-binding HxlR family transcriptional regulator